MVRIESICIQLDMGIIPPVNRIKGKIISLGIMKDFGVIPPKNFFRSKISVIGIGEDIAENGNLHYQVN